MSDDLDEFLRRREMAASAPARAAVRAAAGSKHSPDAVAQHTITARKYGVTPDVVATVPELFRNEDEADAADQAIASSPRLNPWLARSPNNAAMARDDLPVLASTANAIADRKPRPSIWQ